MLKKKKDKKILETKGVKVNFKKRTLKLPEKALKILETSIKGKISNHGKDGTYVIGDIGTYTKNGSKEICYRNAYLSKDYLIFPLSVDNIKVPKILDKDEIEVIDEEVETIKDNNSDDIESLYDNLMNDMREKQKEIAGSDDDNIIECVFPFVIGSETEFENIGLNSYFIYNNELYVKLKTGSGFSPRRLPEMTLLSSIVDTKKVDIHKLKVIELLQPVVK